MSPKVATRTATRGSFDQFRAARLAEQRLADRGEPATAINPARRSNAWWRYATKEPLSKAEQRVLSEGTGAAGNYLVPKDFYDQVIRVARDLGSVAKVAREVLTVGGRPFSIPEVTAYGSGAWTSENASYSLTDDSFNGLLALGAYKAETMCLVSEELLADAAIQLDTYLADQFGARLAVLEGTAFVLGDGIGKPLGALANFPVSTAATGSSTSFTLADVVEALHTVSPFYRQQGGAWIVSDGALKALRKVVSTAGEPILIDPATPAGEIMLLGYPVYVDTNMPSPAANAKSVMFAGWRAAYVIRRALGLSAVLRLNELFALNGQVGFALRERVDGRVLLSAAGVALAHSAT